MYSIIIDSIFEKKNSFFSFQIITKNYFFSAIHENEDAFIKDFPYQVAIEDGYGKVCSGAIISNTTVVTAGRCVSFIEALWYKVRAGTHAREKGGSVHKIKGIHKHHGYHTTGGIYLNDIALVIVEQPFVFDDTRRPIKLYDAAEKLTPGVSANMSGFGNFRLVLVIVLMLH